MVDAELDRQALDHLDPVPRRILGREQCEAVAGAGAEARDAAGQLEVGKGIDLEGRALADAHMVELVFLEIALDPQPRPRQREHRLRRRDVAAELELIDLGDDAVLRGADRRIAEVEPRAFERGLCSLDRRLPLGRRRDAAGQCRGNAGILLDRGRDLLARGLRGEHRLVVLRLRRDALGEQRLLARRLALRVSELVAAGLERRFALAIARSDRGDLGARAGQFGRGFVDGRLIRRGVDPEQDVARLDALVIVDRDRDDGAADIGADRDQPGLEIAIVGRFVAAAAQIEIHDGQHCDDRRQQQQGRPQATPGAGLAVGGLHYGSRRDDRCRVFHRGIVGRATWRIFQTHRLCSRKAVGPQTKIGLG